MIGAVVTFLLNMVLVAQFGESKQLENYLILFNLFLVIVTLIRMVLSTVFIPKYLEIKRSEEESIGDFTNQVLTVLLLLSLLLVFVFIFFNKLVFPIIAPGSYTTISDSDWVMYKFFSIYLLFNILYSYLSSIFIANRRVLMGTIYVLFQNSAPLLFFVFFKTLDSIILAHTIVSALLFFFYLYNVNKITRIRVKSILKISKNTLELLKSTSPVFFSNLLTKFISVYEKSLASTFSMGTVVVLDFSYKLVSRFVGIVSSGATISSYPVIVESVLENDDKKLNRIISFSMSTVLLVSCSILSLLIVLNNDLLSYIFSFGEMENISERFYYPMLIYSIAFIFLNTNDLLSKICFSYGFIKFISIVNVLQVLMNIALILLLKQKYAEMSIPISYMIVLLIVHIVLIIRIKTRNSNIRLYFSGKINNSIILLITFQILLSVVLSRVYIQNNLVTLFFRMVVIGLFFLYVYAFMFKKIRRAIKDEK